MSELQLITADEESRAVTVEPVGTDLAPTVQVSLAKRIIHPRTNKVVCLAAQTTVPMEEDEQASVSDLALRLSDGTNVVLSMSFFNDEVLAGGVPLAKNRRIFEEPIKYETYRSSYDPERYETHRAPDDSWRLWLVFAGICAAAVGGFFYLVPGSFERSTARIIAAIPPISSPKSAFALPSHKVSPPLKSAVKKNSARSAQKRDAIARSPKTAKPARHVSHAFVRDTTSVRDELSIRDGKSVREPMPSRQTKSSRRHSSAGMLVPPPPPTIPSGQLQMFSFAPYAMPDLNAINGTSAINAPWMKGPSQTPQKANQTKPGAVAKTSATPSAFLSKPVSTAAAAAKSIEPMPAASSARPFQAKQQPSYNIFTDDIELPAATRNTSAPLPGAGSDPQLERITLP